MMSVDNYVIRESRHDESIGVSNFLTEHHLKEDVIAQGFASKYGSLEVKCDADGFMMRYTSLIVVQGEEIVGAVFLFPAEDDLKPAGLSGKSEELNNAIIKIYNESGLFRKYNPKKMLKIRKLGVHREHRGQGLAKRLIKESCIWARRHGYEVVFSLFSTLATKKAAENVEFVKFLDVDLRELKNGNGERILVDCGENNVVGLMTKEIK